MKTFNTFEDYANYPVTEKITLATIDCKQRQYGFALESGNIYSVVTDIFVAECQEGITSLESVSSSGSVTSGKFHFDPITSKLYIYSTVAFTEEETDLEIIPTYRLFFANSPINLSWDLQDTSEQVHWEARIKEAPSFSTQLDGDQTGISITGSGNLKLNNGDFYFKDFYNLYNFENQKCTVYSFQRSLDPSQAKIIYSGTISDKAYSSKEVSFKVKDDISKLDESIPLGLFSEITDDINVTEDVSQYFKRRIYGKVQNMKVQSVDMLYDSVLDKNAFELPDNITCTIGSRMITGLGFNTYLTLGDQLVIGEETYSIDSILSPTKLFISEDFPRSYVGKVKIIPDVSWYNTNRKFLIAGHALADISTTITQVVQRNRIVVADASKFKVGDYVDVNSQHLPILRIHENKLIMSQNLANPQVGDTVSKDKVQNVLVYDPDKKETIQLFREDYSITETTEGSYLNITADAERNATPEKTLSGSFYCVNDIDIIWSGVPSIFKLVFPANVAGGLYGKYFTLYTDKKAAIFYFEKYVPADQYDTIPTPEYKITKSVSLVSATDIFTCNSHGWVEGMQVQFTAAAIPGNMTENYSYFIRTVTTNTFQVSATIDGPISDFSSSGTTVVAALVSETFPITLTSDTMTATQVAEISESTIFDNLEVYYTKNNGASITIYSKSSGPIIRGDNGDCGISIETLLVGRLSDQGIDLTKSLKPRDFVKIKGLDDLTYQEVFEVYTESFRLRSAFIEDSGIKEITYKSVKYVDNDSNIFVDTSSKLDTLGNEIQLASDVVKDLLTEAGLYDRLDLDSFVNSKVSMPYVLSLKLPADITGSSPTLKDVVDQINNTVLGSLVLSNDLKLSYNCLDSERDTQNLPIISNDNIISWEIRTVTNNYRDILAKYRFSDLEKLPNLQYNYTDSYSNKYTDSIKTLEIDLDIYDVEEVAQRRLYFTSRSRSEIVIKSDLNLYSLNMGDTVILDLLGMYNRLGNKSSNKIVAKITSVKRSGETIDIVLSSVGGDVYSRSGVISANTSLEFDSATDDEKLYSSYITANNGTINNQSDLYSTNSIA